MANSPQPKTWRDVLPVHPAADLFPRMSESELRELGEDIKKNGLQSRITLWSERIGQGPFCLIDGRNRLDAMESVGVPILDETGWPLDCCFASGDPYDFVLSLNIHRRHLTAEQKRELIAKVLKAKPEQSDRQIAKQTKTSPTTVGKIRKESEAAGDVSKLDTRTDTKGRKQPSTKSKKSVKKAEAGETFDVVGFVLGETPTTSVPGLTADEIARAAKVLDQRRSVGAKDIALSHFNNWVLELARLTRSQQPVRFTKTAVSFGDLNKVGQFLIELANLKSRAAEVSTEQRSAEHAALDEASS